MCQFKSGVIKRSGYDVIVHTLPFEDSHFMIREHFNIGDKGLDKLFYESVELIPTQLNFEDKSYWKLEFDDISGNPFWWNDKINETVITQLLQAAKADFDAIMSGQVRKGDLYLCSLTSIPDNFNPIVTGHLDLNGLSSVPQGFSPQVGGSLYLSGLHSVPEGFKPTVGKSLFLHGMSSVPDECGEKVTGLVRLKIPA